MSYADIVRGILPGDQWGLYLTFIYTDVSQLGQSHNQSKTFVESGWPLPYLRFSMG